MNEGWIKLHRKLKDNDIFCDPIAFTLFNWLLLSVNKETGEYKAGRYQLSEILKINSNTLYKALKRLEKKYKMVTLTSNNKYTKITLLNWSKYQDRNEIVTQDSNNKVTPGEQQSNNKVTLNKNKELRNKNKEYINILHEDKPRELLKKRNFSEKQQLYQRICTFLEETLHTKFTNYPKQMKAIKTMLDSGYTEKQINYVITQMANEEWYQDKGFDLMTVMNQMPLYKAKARKVVNVSSKAN